MNLVKKAWAALKPKTVAALQCRLTGVRPCAYCGAEEPCAWSELEGRTYECVSAYVACPSCSQSGPKAPTLEAAKKSWDAAQLAEVSNLKKQAPTCFEEEEVTA